MRCSCLFKSVRGIVERLISNYCCKLKVVGTYKRFLNHDFSSNIWISIFEYENFGVIVAICKFFERLLSSFQEQLVQTTSSPSVHSWLISLACSKYHNVKLLRFSSDTCFTGTGLYHRTYRCGTMKLDLWWWWWWWWILITNGGMCRVVVWVIIKK